MLNYGIKGFLSVRVVPNFSELSLVSRSLFVIYFRIRLKQITTMTRILSLFTIPVANDYESTLFLSFIFGVLSAVK